MRVSLIFLFFTMFALTACGSRANDPWLAKTRAVLAGGAADPALPLRDQQAQTRAAIRDSDFAGAVLMVTLPKRGAVATMVAVSDTRRGVTWMDGSGIAVTMLDGVVISTRGLGHDVMASDVRGTLSALRGATGSYVIARRSLDASGALITRKITCTAHKDQGTLKETCSGSRTAVENQYVKDANGRARSQQWLGPALGYIELERLK